MKIKVYSVFDSKAEAFLQPFFSRTRGEAIRSWTDAVNQETSNFFKYAGDFSLFELGEFDDSNASFALHPSPVSLGLAIEFVRSSSNSNISSVK